MSIIKHQVWAWVTQYLSSWTRNFTWWGKAFNPNDEWVLIYTGGDTGYPDIISGFSSINLSSYNAWTEVVLWLTVFQWPEVWTWTRSIIDPDWITIWGPSSVSVNLSSGYWSWAWAWTGMRHAEISKNWTYTYRSVLPSWTLDTTFTVTWLVTSQFDRFPSGYIWVEWDTLAYTDGCDINWTTDYWYKHRIPNDWYNGWSWLTPGMIWIDSSDHWKIYFIDSSWIKRRTILWDYQWVTYDWWEMPQTPGTWSAWYIWVEWTWHWTYLKFVANDGKVYRISHVTNLQ